MSTLPDAGRQERARNLLFLADPERWPAWPFLPLVRRSAGGEMTCGLLCDLMALYGLTGFRATVFVTNLFTVPPDLEGFLALPKETFDTAEEVFEAGWRVD